MTYGPLRFTSISMTPCGYTSGASGPSLGVMESHISLPIFLKLGKKSREKLPNEVRKPSPSSQELGVTRVSISRNTV